jgi:hypothetical protein
VTRPFQSTDRAKTTEFKGFSAHSHQRSQHTASGEGDRGTEAGTSRGPTRSGNAVAAECVLDSPSTTTTASTKATSTRVANTDFCTPPRGEPARSEPPLRAARWLWPGPFRPRSEIDVPLPIQWNSARTTR